MGETDGLVTSPETLRTLRKKSPKHCKKSPFLTIEAEKTYLPENQNQFVILRFITYNEHRENGTCFERLQQWYGHLMQAIVTRKSSLL